MPLRMEAALSLTHAPGQLAVGWCSVTVVTTELTSAGPHPPAGEAGLAPRGGRFWES